MYSITKILRETSDRTAINNWIARVGKKEAEAISKKALERGARLDTDLEKYLQDGEVTDCVLFTQAYKVLCEFSEHLYFEQAVSHPLGFIGRFDYLGLHSDGKIRLIDWKTSTNPKKEEYVLDYKLQVVACIKAAESTLSVKIDSGEVVVCVEQWTLPERFPVFNQDIEPLWEQFQERLKKFKEECVPTNLKR